MCQTRADIPVFSGKITSEMKQLTSRAGGHHNMSPPLQVDLWPCDLQSAVQITCDVGYLCTNFSLPRPICSRLRSDVRDRRQALDRRQKSEEQSEEQTRTDRHQKKRIIA